MLLTLFILFILIVIVSAYLAYKKVNQLEFARTPKNIITLKIELAKPLNYNNPALVFEKLLCNLHSLVNTASAKNNELMSFELLVKKDNPVFYLTIPKEIKDFVESQIYPLYPQIIIKESLDILGQLKDFKDIKIKEATLQKKDYFPIKYFKEFKPQNLPLNRLIKESLKILKSNSDSFLFLQFIILPKSDNWQSLGYKYLKEINKKPLKNTKDDLLGIPLIEQKLKNLSYSVNIRVLVKALNKDLQEDLLKKIESYFLKFSLPYMNSFKLKNINLNLGLDKIIKREWDAKGSFILGTLELSAMYFFTSNLRGLNKLASTEKVTEFGEDLYKKIKYLEKKILHIEKINSKKKKIKSKF